MRAVWWFTLSNKQAKYTKDRFAAFVEEQELITIESWEWVEDTIKVYPYFACSDCAIVQEFADQASTGLVNIYFR